MDRRRVGRCGIWDDRQLAARIDEVGATIVICEADMCVGEVLERPLVAIGSTRGDPTNVDIAGGDRATASRSLHAPGRNADGVAEMTVALLLAVTRHIIPADADVRAGQVFRTAPSPTSATGPGSSPGRTAGIVGLGAVGRATKWRFEGLGMKVIAARPVHPRRHPLARRRCWPRPTSSRCTRRSRPTRSG